MKKSKGILAIFVLSIIGTLFAGYLSASRLLAAVCPVREGCPFIGGLPACVYGFIIFLTLLILSSIELFSKAKIIKSIMWVSLIGILFSAYSTYLELAKPAPLGYSLLLPTCVYGFVMYAIIFACAIHCIGKEK